MLLFRLLLQDISDCFCFNYFKRVTRCLRVACRKSGFEDCKRLIDCGHGSDYGSLVGNPTWNEWIQNVNSTACFNEDGFPYGIHAKVVHLTFEDRILTRYLYSFFWGFQVLIFYRSTFSAKLFFII